MFRVVLLLVLSFATTCLGQEALSKGNHATTSDVSDTNSGSPGVPSKIVSTEPETLTVAAPSSISSSAQLPQSDPAMLQAATVPLQPLLVRNAEPSKKAIVRLPRTWWVLTAAQHGAATFDAWSTRQSITSGRGYERNPLMKPFADSAAIYPVIQVLPLGLDYLSRRMAQSRHSALRKTWWVPQTIATAGFVWSGVRNLRVASGK